MTLSEKFEKARKCSSFNKKLTNLGNCEREGYAPFDCDNCTSYNENKEKKFKINDIVFDLKAMRWAKVIDYTSNGKVVIEYNYDDTNLSGIDEAPENELIPF